MKKAKKVKGKCHLCGNIRLLTFEHIPPQSAFNKNKITESPGLDAIGNEKPHWEIEDLKKKLHQGGIKAMTLCDDCNNNTGSWYGGHYLNFIRSAFKNVEQRREVFNAGGVVNLNLMNINPLKTIKQIVSMFFSINADTFAECNPQLQSLVLEKNGRSIDSTKYSFSLYILSGSLGRRIGLSAMINNYSRQQRTLTELACPPFGYVLEINRPENAYNPFCDITHFANDYLPETMTNISLNVPVLESNTTFLFDYRSKSRILDEGEMANDWMCYTHDAYYSFINLDENVLLFVR